MEWEIKVLEAFQQWQGPILDVLFKFSNWIGRGECIAVFIIIGIWRHIANREKSWAIFWPVTGILTLSVIKGLKAFIGRDRPQLFGEHAIHVDPGSMPSGHAVGATLFLCLLAIYWCRKCPHLKLPIWIAAIVGIVWIDLGRLYFAVHWPTDIVAGSAIGAAISAILYFTVLRKPGFFPATSGAGQMDPVEKLD